MTISVTRLAGSPAAPNLERAVALAEVQAFDLGMFDPTGQAAVAVRAGGFFTGLDGTTRVRILALSRPFSAEPAIRAVQDLRRTCHPEEDWKQSGLAGLQTFLETLVRAADLRSTQYFLLAWPGPELPHSAIFRAAQDGFLTKVTAVDDLPAFFDDCREEWGRLVPRERGTPYMAVYGAYEFVGHWNLTTIQLILRMPFPVAVAIDIETLSPDKAQFQLQSGYNALQTQLQQQGRFGGVDTRSQEAFKDIQRAMDYVEAGERIHKVTLAILIKAPNGRKLATDGAYLVSTLSPYVRLRLLRGQQAAALQLFTTLPRTEIGLDLRARPIASSGCGLLTPFGLPSRIETRGILWGIDKTTGNPIFYDGWAGAAGEGGRPFHATFFGFTGYGKTFAMQTLLYRLALTGTQVVVVEPQGHFRRLAMALGGGATYNEIAFETASLNLLDIVQPTLTDQVSHVKRMLALLLSCESGAAANGTEQGRRVFTNDESAALGVVLLGLYKPLWPQRQALTAAQMPLLGNLCERLEVLEDDDLADLSTAVAARVREGRRVSGEGRRAAGACVARQIRQLYVDGEKAGSFNRPTNLDLRFDRQCTVFDVKRIDPDYRPLYYMQLTAVLNLYLRAPTRTQPLVIAIDEFRFMARDPILAREANNLVKTARTFRTAVWTADQNPGTYMQNEDGRQMVALSSLVLIGRQQAEDVEMHKHLFRRLTPHHIHQMVTAERGQFVTIMGDDYYVLQVEPSPVELAAFRGT